MGVSLADLSLLYVFLTLLHFKNLKELCAALVELFAFCSPTENYKPPSLFQEKREIGILRLKNPALYIMCFGVLFWYAFRCLQKTMVTLLVIDKGSQESPSIKVERLEGAKTGHGT